MCRSIWFQDKKVLFVSNRPNQSAASEDESPDIMITTPEVSSCGPHNPESCLTVTRPKTTNTGVQNLVEAEMCCKNFGLCENCKYGLHSDSEEEFFV